jgi:nickel-dependent lactate racemase
MDTRTENVNASRIEFAERLDGELGDEELEDVIRRALEPFSDLKRVLLIHPDYSRHDFTDRLVPIAYNVLEGKGLVRLDTLNASGTHRAMSQRELRDKLGLAGRTLPHLGTLYNHVFDDPDQLVDVAELPADFVLEKTGHLNMPMQVTANKLITDGYDLVIAVSGTVPHEAIGMSGGLKIFFPGISGPEVIALLHWAAVLVGIPKIIGTIENPARDIVTAGARHYFGLLGDTPAVSFNMLYSELGERVQAKGFYVGEGLDGFTGAHRKAAAASAQIHIVYIDEAKECVVQCLPEMYDEVWTAGKGSYKLQRPGVMAPGGEVILYAPHIDCFHSNATMDAEIRRVGYHGTDWVVDFCNRHPEFNKNVAAHAINVRGPSDYRDGTESFAFDVTLATAIGEKECRAAGLGYRDPASLRSEDFEGQGRLWISDGGKWLYDRG